MGNSVFFCLFCAVCVALHGTIYVVAETTEATSTASANEGAQDGTGGNNTTPIVTTTTTTTTSKPEVSTLETGLNSQDHIAELEQALNEKQMEKYMVFRSEASNNRTLHVTSDSFDNKYEATLCVQSSGDSKVQIQVIGVRYSNDGPSDRITLDLDGKRLGTAQTDEFYNGGNEWNVIKDTGPIGEAITLDNGNHTLLMTVETDQWGAEFDTITIRMHNQDPLANIICRSEFV